MRLDFLKKLLAALALACLLLCGCALADGLDVHFMNIDRNDGILIVCDGEAAFIDSGMPRFGTQAVEYMQSQGISSLRYYIGTHAHRDHVGGGAKILTAMHVGEVIAPHDGVRKCMLSLTENAAEKQAIAEATYHYVKQGDVLTLGGATLTVIGPASYQPYVSPTYVPENFNSLIIRLSYGETSFLLTGDAYSNTLKQLERANPGALKCDVFKNPHHNAMVDQLVFEAAKPQYVLYSTDDRHLPGRTSLQRAAGVGARVLITSGGQNGHVVFHSDGTSLRVDAQSGPEKVVLREEALTVYEGRAASLHAQVQPRGFVSAFVYTVLDPEIASMDGQGRVKGLQAGETVIRVSAGNGVYADCRLTVSPASVRLSKEELTLRQGASATLRATLLPAGTRGLNLTWTSDDEKIASVSAKGKVVALSVGETAVRARLDNGQEAVCRVTVAPVEVWSVSVSPSRLTLTLGEEKGLTARVSPANATDPTVRWESADESVAAVDGLGGVRAVGVGKTVITARAGDREHTVAVTVRPVYVQKVTLTAGTTTLVCGLEGADRVTLTAAVLPENATIQELTWKSGNARVAQVDAQGNVTAVSPGTATIYAAAADGSRRSAALRVNVIDNRYDARRPLTEQGRVILSAKSLRYEDGQLHAVLYVSNRSGRTLTFPAPDALLGRLSADEYAPARVTASAPAVRHGATATLDVYYALADCPALANLNLPALGGGVRRELAWDD